jgi:ferredoxin
MDQLRALDRGISEIEGSSAEPSAPRELRSRRPPDGGDGVLGATAIVDRERCLSCGVCADICPEHAITMADTAEVDSHRCNGCGACVDECPTEALSLSESKVATAL